MEKSKFVPIVCLVALFLAGPSAMPARAATEVVEDGIRFTYVDPLAGAVSVAGSFNDWSTTATPMVKDGDVWSAVVSLEQGEHEYKYVVDGQWTPDPDNPVTTGEYGNSAVTVGSDGSLTAMQATSNTPFSPKIWMGGRVVGLYRYMEREDRGDRFELEKPTLDLDLAFKIRINQDLDAYLLTNINNEAENVEFWQTRLNFDRGSLTLDNPTIFLQAWDNVGTTTWDDPLHLIGDVGIYSHDFGFNQAGARVRKEFFGFDVELLYSDNAEEGGGGSFEVPIEDAVSPVVLNDQNQYEFGAPSLSYYGFSDNSNQEDVLAARVTRSFDRFLGGSWRTGLMLRADRGYHPGAIALIEVVPTDTSQTIADASIYEASSEEWWAWGGDLRYTHASGRFIEAEYLRGREQIDAREGEKIRLQLETIPNGEEPELGVTESDVESTADRKIKIDESNRAYLGAGWVEGPLGFDWSGSWEYQDHTYGLPIKRVPGEIENWMSVFRARAGRSWAHLPVLGRAGEASVSLEQFEFEYDKDATWDQQFWFDERNFWLESNEHEVAFHRLTLLGGRDAFALHPELRLRLEEDHRVDLTYRATLASQGIGHKPKYFESLFQVTGFLGKGWRAYLDTRVAAYDDPVLELDRTYGSTFLELAYMPIDGVSIALSFGVDPYAIDDPVNEYAYVGRDLFLFAEGANGSNAESRFLNMGEFIQQAERKLEEERRIQLEAILKF